MGAVESLIIPNGRQAMTGYVIFDVGPSDREAMKPYIDKAFVTLIPFGGKVLARTNNIDIREGTHGLGWKPRRILIIEFPTVEAAKAWYESPEYQEILPIRLKFGKDNMVIVEGIPKV
jgi:uncharacterized protein (DUF1330 family)